MGHCVRDCGVDAEEGKVRAYTLMDKDGNILSFGDSEGAGDAFWMVFGSRDKAMAVGESINETGALHLRMDPGDGPFTTLHLTVEGMKSLAGPIDGSCPDIGDGGKEDDDG